MESLTQHFPTLSEAELLEWNEAYVRVSAYFRTLRIRNRQLLSDLTLRSLRAAMQRAATNPELNPMLAAMQEAQALLDDWSRKAGGSLQLDERERFSDAGRLAGLLGAMPEDQQVHFFLQPSIESNPEPLKSQTFPLAVPASRDREMRSDPIRLGLMAALVRVLERPWISFGLVSAAIIISLLTK